MFGIMLARPASSLIAEVLPWPAVFLLSAAVMMVLMVVLGRLLPPRRPTARISYRALLASMGRLAAGTPVLRRRALYQAAMFGAFSLFWTTTPLLLAGPAFHLSQGGIALFALAGVAGAVAAPIAGRMADRGLIRAATLTGMSIAIAAFLITHLAPTATPLALALLVIAAISLDFAVTTTLVVGQRVIFGLGADLRSRLNGLYMATFFVGGAMGSAVGAWAYAQGGWWLASLIGAALPFVALAYAATEGSASRRKQASNPSRAV
jgi:predicted MFS family arabinose efflux permease